MNNYTLAVLKADKNNISESFAKAIAFLEKNESNKLNAFYAYDYKFIKKNEPETFDKIKAFVEAGRLQPLSGWWYDSTSEKISDENLARNTLFSQKFFARNFGRPYLIAYGKPISNRLSSEILFRSKINCYIEENSESKTTLYWIDTKNIYRVLGASAELLPVKSIDEITDEDETVTLDTYFSNVLYSTDDIDDIKEVDFENTAEESKTEKLLLKAEMLDAVNVIKNNGETKIKEIKCAWKALLASFPCAEEKAEEIAKELEGVSFTPDELFETTSKTVELLAFKKCCKKSDDILIRVRQTAPVSEKIAVKSKILDAAFWVDIEPYEIRSFLINAEGTPIESNFIENVDF